MLNIPYKPENIHTGSDQKYIWVPFCDSALDVAQSNSVSTLWYFLVDPLIYSYLHWRHLLKVILIF